MIREFHHKIAEVVYSKIKSISILLFLAAKFVFIGRATKG